MPKKFFCCLMMIFGITCTGNAFAFGNEDLSNTSYLISHDVKKVVIGKSLSNCKAPKVIDRYVGLSAGLKTCDNANVSDLFNMAAAIVRYSASQVLPRKVMKMVDNVGISGVLSFEKHMTRYGLEVTF